MRLEDVARAHRDAYDAIFDEHILESIVAGIPPLVAGRARVVIEELHIQPPFLQDKDHISIDRRLLPRECRERGLTYRGRATMKMSLFYDGNHVISENKNAGFFPIMVGSKLCHLSRASSMSEVGEDDHEGGGYFIVNGIDKVVRLHIGQKRNHVLAISRERRGSAFTRHMVSMRCVGRDETGQMNSLHYCTNGDMVLKIYHRRRGFFLPLGIVLRALANTTDEELFEALGGGQNAVHFLKNYDEHSSFSKRESLDYLGSKFRVVFGTESNADAGADVLHRCVAVHLTSSLDKFNFLILAARKLLSFVAGDIVEDNPDLPSNHELVTVTQLLSSVIKDRLEDVLRMFHTVCRKALWKGRDGAKRDVEREETVSLDLLDVSMVKELFKKIDSNVGLKIESFLSTGNLNIFASSDIQENSGIAVVADRINFYRYISHFRSVNRGSFFATLKTTSVRKLRPESWGFLCPVHTPDGAPCGLITHLSAGAEVVTAAEDFDPDVLFGFGVVPVIRGTAMMVPVLLDGCVVGSTSAPSTIATLLREYRNRNGLRIEVVHVDGPGLFPSVLIFTSAGRFARKVLNKRLQSEEWIGIMEQVFLNIDLEGHERYMDAEFGQAHYCEIDNTNMLSILAGLTPYSDHNQSPRNMYQCQMAKQAMGLPSHNMRTRTDVRLYAINYTQSPVVQTQGYELLRDYPQGINCIVAVLAYTAYDMEDAVVINKSSMERGLFTGYVYKTERAELDRNCHFSHLPFTGQSMSSGDVLYKYINEENRECTERYRGFDAGVIDTVRVFQNDQKRCALFTIRVVRNPSIGDKFCSRHGQKGVCSMHWPMIDMPFTETGAVPDIIINPHAFPSRMTIGMLLEAMAGKAGCLDGQLQDGTPFKKNTFLDEEGVERHGESIGDALRRHGFNYHGNEAMYSGVSGNELRVDVFIGVVFYQRLRHMVSDKFQVRTGGAVVATTRQPVGGRKKQGGVRFGEMERDALIAHGSSQMLQDRLLRCSDAATFEYCGECRSILFADTHSCRCGCRSIKTVEMPYVFRYLCSELLAMNIRVKIDF